MTDRPAVSVANSDRPGQDQGQARQPQSRARSTIAFPYVHLENCIAVAQAVHAVGGDACEWTQLAAHLGQAPDGGSFRQRLISARTYGLIEYSNRRVSLTDIGRECIDGVSAKPGRTRAFLNVPLFREMFRKLDGQPLPPQSAIESQMVDLGVAPKQAGKARQSFLRSARDAAFFEISPDRMTQPATTDPTPRQPAQPEEVAGGSDTAGDKARHPLIEALLDQMPPPGGEWEVARCLIWVQTLVSSLSIVYTNLDELQSITVGTRSSGSSDAS